MNNIQNVNRLLPSDLIMNPKYDLLSSFAPEMPKKLPKFIKIAIGPVPDVVKPAAANALFAPLSALMKDVDFEYLDGVKHEPTMMCGVVGPSSIGKGYVDTLLEVLCSSLRKHDKESRQKLEKYAIEYKKAGANKTKPERPRDAAILVPEPDMSNPAFIQLLMDAEREGNRALYTNIPEIDLLDGTCGNHKKVKNVIRLNFDTKNYGAERATTDGITGNPILRWRFNFATTEKRAQQFFKDGLIDGTLGRISISYVQKPMGAKPGIPKQGKYDDRFMQKLEPFIERITHATGTIKVSHIKTLMDRLINEMADISDLSEDNTFQSLSNRSLVIAWLKGCLLYVLDGERWSKEIAEFVEWSLYYDLWSKIALFAPQWQSANQKVEVDPRKYGPANMLDMLPISFSRDQLEKLREDKNKPKSGIAQLCTWKDRNYITFDESKQLYTKTEEYLAKHPQQDSK